MSNSINTNISAYFAQANIGTASAQSSASVSRLSSGNRIVKASDDVAALSTGTSLKTQVMALKTALVNASQGTSLLQVADGALSQVTEILQRQKAISLQAGSGSLTDTDRGYLDQEFQALSTEIDRLTGATNFNGVKLLNGALSTVASVADNTTAAAKSSASVNITGLATGETLILNGVTLTFTDAAPAAAGGIQRGTSIAQSIDNAVAYLNGVNDNVGATALSAANKILISSAVYSRSGDSLVVTSRSGGNLSEFYTIDSLAANNGTSTVTVNGLGAQGLAQLSGFTAANIDTSVAASAPTAVQLDSDAVLSFNAVTVATLAAGDTLRGIQNKVNALTSSTGVSAFITGKSGAYVLNLSSATSTAGLVTANTGAGASLTFGVTVSTTMTSATGGGTTGLAQGSVTGAGSTGGSSSLLTDQTQAVAKSVISFPEIAAGDLTSTTNFGTDRDITIEGQVFTFNQTALTARSQTDITIGATLQETLDNAVSAINAFSGASAVNYAFRQISAHREGNSIVIENRQTGNALDSAAGTITVATTSSITGTSVSSANLSGTTNTGIDTKGVVNEGFIGVIKDFSSTYVSPNLINLSVAVGGITYSANNVTSNPTSNTDVRMISSTGGYFDMKLRANQGVVASSQADATLFAQKLDAAFAGVTFSQKRDLTSYAPSGDLLGSSVKVQDSDFSALSISDIKVTAPAGSNPNGTITFTMNGEAYTSQSTLGTQLGSNSITRFVSASDVNKFIEFKNGATALSMSSTTTAATLEANLKAAFGVTAGASSLSFQVGSSSSDTLKVSIGSAQTSSLYDGLSLNVLSQANAVIAGDQLDKALATVTALRASVGALQSRFNFAAANIQIAVQNQDAARGELLDTDVATESTAFATSQVKIQAGISVLAQANQQLQNLLKLIQ